jgi:hypothetical protein
MQIYQTAEISRCSNEQHINEVFRIRKFRELLKIFLKVLVNHVQFEYVCAIISLLNI